MKIISSIVGTLSILIGIGLLLLAMVSLSTIMSGASTAQAAFSQSEGTFFATLSGAFFLLAIAVQIGNVVRAIKDNTETIKFFENKKSQ